MSQENPIWILEDDEGLQFIYEQILGPHHALTMFGTLAALQKELTAPAARAPSLLIADLRLPDGSTLDLLSSPEGPALASRWPLIVASFLDDLEVLRECFRRGAFDYLTKPFNRSELIVKVERALQTHASRRTKEEGDLELNPTTLGLARAGCGSVTLTHKEFQIAWLLKEAGDRAVKRNELELRLWNGAKVARGTLDVHLASLRKKLGQLRIELEYVPPGAYRFRQTTG